MSRRLDIEHGVIDMSFGAGGMASAQLTREIFAPELSNPILDRMEDGAVIGMPSGRLVVSTDSHVISPIFFPGGDIGSLAIHGSVNDVSMMGATPLYMSVGFIIEEGTPFSTLKRVAESMGRAARDAGVSIVAADTKVVKKGEADQLYITSTCFGVVAEDVQIGADRAREGDSVIVSGFIGDHGAAVLACREEFGMKVDLQSDSQSLGDLVAIMLASGVDIRCMRDPTRGGLATSLNEIAATSGVGIEINESAVPVREGVRAVSELLGLDSLYFACEGRLAVICAAKDADRLLACMQSHPKGEHAAIIGGVTGKREIPLILHSTFGGSRVVSVLTGDQMPRIC
ncbi:MAG: hydrogenase expression/formation protein HypE [Mariprofundaceae bacterium]